MDYPRLQTQEAFDSISFHDDRLWGIDFLLDEEAITSDLKLDIDHICEWVKLGDGCSYNWRVAPADLIFRGVTGLKLTIDWKDETYRMSVAGPYILDIKRERIENQLVYLDRPYYKWEVLFNDESHLSFGAWGFDLTLRNPPILRDNQCLPFSMRR